MSPTESFPTHAGSPLENPTSVGSNSSASAELGVGSPVFEEQTVSIRGIWKVAFSRIKSGASDEQYVQYVPSDDAKVYAEAGRASIGLKEPQKPYDPLSGFTKSHMSKRAGFGERPAEPVDRSLYPTTTLQEMQAVRSNLRVDAVNKRQHLIGTFTSLYGDVLYSKKAVEEMLRSGRYTSSQKNDIRKAGRIVRRADDSNYRLHMRLGRTSEGKDIPERLTTTHDKMSEKVMVVSSEVGKAIGKTALAIDGKAWGLTKSGGRKVKALSRKNN